MEAENGVVTNYKSLLFSENRDFLVRNDGHQVKALDGKTIGVYFSAHWCGPCRRFTPKLVDVYNEIKRSGVDFEVVFVSGDDEEENFKEYFSGMPWLAVPFSDSAAKEKLNEAFGVQGIPHLVIIDGRSGAIVESDAVDLVKDYGADAFPFSKERVAVLKEEEEEAKKNQTVTSVLATASRDYVLSSDGAQVRVSELDGKMVAIYFSAKGHGGCDEFSPILIKMYSELKQRGEAFEVVLVSLNMEEKDYKELTKDMPWLALPFKDSSIDKLIRYFELKALPTLVLLSADGKTVNPDLAELVEEHGASAYPFSPEKLAELAELQRKRLEEQTLESILVSGELDYVIGKEGGKVLVKDLVGKTILIYFSAHWCPPCRMFTPKLVEVYEELKAKKHEVEVIFVSSDHDQSSFDEYYSSMPWLALPFGDQRKNFLNRKFKVHGIPTLVAIDVYGRTITTAARGIVMEHGAKAFPFTDEHIKKLEEDAEKIDISWPEQVRHKSHEHELVKTRRKGYICDGCNNKGKGWSFYCKECDYDLHPDCALAENKTEEDNDIEEAEENQMMDIDNEEGKGQEDNGHTKDGYTCEGDVCRRA